MSKAVIERDAIDMIRSLQQPGEESILARILELYLDESNSLCEKINKGIAECNPELVEEAAHSLKSSSANVGAQQVSGLCMELENSGKSGELDRANELFEQFSQALDAAHQELRAILQE